MTLISCPPTAVIFDMDGLLVDSERLWKIAETQMLADRGKIYDDHKHAPYIGMAMQEYLRNIIRVYELDADVDALKRELIQRANHIISKDTEPQPGAHEIVNYVIENNIPYAIASSSPLDVIHVTLGSQSPWKHAFPVRCSADEVTHGKPAPDVYLLAAERLGVAPEMCLALEDSPNGARAAVAAGMTCYAVPDKSYTKAERFEGITPFVFNSLHEVLEILENC